MIKYISKKLVKTTGIVALTALSTFVQAQTINWAPAGPLYTVGRIRNMVVDKTDASGNTLYAGSTTSGVFTSTNGGVSWAGLPSTVANRVTSYMAQAANGVIFVATGEGFLRPSEKLKAQPGSGLYKIVSGNLVQVAPASATGSVITKVACSPVDPSIVAIAGSNGILISIDGGSTFTVPAGIPTSTDVITGQDLKFDNSGILYCTIGNEKFDLPAANANVYSKILKSNANLTNFTDITPTAIVGVPVLDFGRIELAVAPTNNNVIYASCANKFKSTNRASSTTQAFMVSYDAGSSWALISIGSAQLDPLGNGGTAASGDKAHCLTVDPFNAERVFIGSYQLYSWTRNNGSNTNPVGNWQKIGLNFIPNFQLYIHENVHDVKFVTSGSSISKSYIITDAGLFRSVDNLLTFQPFYQGIVTGQFNTVSIERYPVGVIPTASGSNVTPYSGFIGGTSNAGLNYFSGNYPTVTVENSFLGGEVNAAELSKILPSVAYVSTSDGKIYLNSDVKTSAFAQKDAVKNTYGGTPPALTGQSTIPFAVNAFSVTGVPFKLWENYGQRNPSPTFTPSPGTPDSLVFYNDSLRLAASFVSANTLSTQTLFSFSAPRPNKFALIDSVVVRTGTVQLSTGGFSPTFSGNNLKQIHLATVLGYTVSPAAASNTVPISVPIQTPVMAYQGGGTVTTPPTSSICTTSNTITLNQSTLTDNISVTFSVAPYANFTATTTNPAFYRVFCTVFYKYKVADTVYVVDNTISTKTATYTIKVDRNLSWRPISVCNSSVVAIQKDSVRKHSIQKVASAYSSRFAFPGVLNRIYVSTNHLSLNDPISYIAVGGDGALTDDNNGVKTNSVITIPGKPTILEWSKTGLELYYATDDNKLYRISHLHTLLDSTARNYNGKLYSTYYKFNASGTPNPNCPYRTTLLGTFTKPITSISIAESNTLMALTFNDPTGTSVMTSTADISKSDFNNIGFTSSTGNLVTALGASGAKVNCSLIEKTAPYKTAFVGTDIGLYYTPDITVSNPVWTGTVTNVNLPTAQIFDIKQQTLKNYECYNSGQIYVATNGRGVWLTNNYFAANVISVKENSKDVKAENNLSVYPNPTSGEVFLNFNGIDGETATITVMDITGKVVLTQYLGKLYTGQISASVDASSLTSGMYIVNINSTSGIKRVAKLVVTK